MAKRYTKLDEMVRGYVTAALWTSTDESDENLDAHYDKDDIASESIRKIKRDCAKFLRSNKAAVRDYVEHNLSYKRSGEGTIYDWLGHDFWLTRNGHGAGFWDRNYGGRDDIGEKLTKASKKFGELYLYVGDDGKVYVS